MAYKKSTNPECISYFNLSELSNFDGPGKRVVIFFQGCNQKCAWCHSPHSQPRSSPLIFHSNLCSLCMRCKDVCPNMVHDFIEGRHILHREYCTKCKKCIDACPRSSIYSNTSALSFPTKQEDVKTLFQKLLPHLLLCGAVTLSGGEALLQLKAVKSFLTLCKLNGIHTAVETSGLLHYQKYLEVLPLIDCLLFGVRVLVEDNNSFLTKKLLSAVRFIKQYTNIEMIPRIPAVPGVMDRLDVLEEILTVLKEINCDTVSLNLWNETFDLYYRASGIDCNFPEPSKEAIKRCQETISEFLNYRAFKI